MKSKNKKRKFISSLTFKIIIAFLIIILMGVVYNLIIKIDNKQVEESTKEEEEKRKAELDTLDIVGDYLWGPIKMQTKEVVETEKEEELDAKKSSSNGSVSSESESDGSEYVEDNNNMNGATNTPHAAPTNVKEPVIESVE